MKSTEALIPAFWSGVLACLAMVTLLHAGGSLYFPPMGCVALVGSPVMFWAARRCLLGAASPPESPGVNAQEGE